MTTPDNDSSVVSEPCRDVLRAFYGDICCRRERGHEGNHRGVSGYDSRYVYWTMTESEQCAPESDSGPVCPMCDPHDPGYINALRRHRCPDCNGTGRAPQESDSCLAVDYSLQMQRHW